MTLLQLKYISTVAKCGSFSKAAQVLYVSQPGISKMVCALEEELGITIFVRSAAGITLTAEGRELLNMGERLLTDAEHISQHFSQDLSKTHETLSVSSQHYCFVIDAMMAYQNTYQKESYTYKFLVGQGPEVIQQVVDKTTELGVLFISSRSTVISVSMLILSSSNISSKYCLRLSSIFSRPLSMLAIVAEMLLPSIPCCSRLI